MLRWAASLEALSEHPLAAAVVDRARADGLAVMKVSDFSAVAGQGVRGTIDGIDVSLGNTRVLAEAHADAGVVDAGADVLRQ